MAGISTSERPDRPPRVAIGATRARRRDLGRFRCERCSAGHPAPRQPGSREVPGGGHSRRTADQYSQSKWRLFSAKSSRATALHRHAARQHPQQAGLCAIRACTEQPPNPGSHATVNSVPTFTGLSSIIFMGTPAA